MPERVNILVAFGGVNFSIYALISVFPNDDLLFLPWLGFGTVLMLLSSSGALKLGMFCLSCEVNVDMPTLETEGAIDV